MSHLPFTLLAYFLNSISVTVNKILLKKDIPDPFAYIFYISIFSLILLPAIIFTQVLSLTVFTQASISTLSWITGAYFMFKALKTGQVSRVIPVIGTILTLILFFEAARTSSISLNQTWAIFFLVMGLIFITLIDWKGKFSKKEILYETISACFFAISYILLRKAYLQAPFFSVLVQSRLILIPLILFILSLPSLRKKVIIKPAISKNSFSKTGLIFLAGQVSGGASELLLLFSISLANPALVNSLQGTQYIFLLVFGLFLKEKYTKLALFFKLVGIIFIAMGLYVLTFPASKESLIGFTFSPRYTREIGLNPQVLFSRILDDFKPKILRLPVYWDEVEAFPNDLNFSKIDYYLDLAQSRNIKVILVLGYKQPRWPECFDPLWVKNLIRSERDLRIINLVQKEIDHFKKYKNIVSWQVENEPFLPFGNCDNPDPKTYDRLKKEIQIVRKADSRPILITDSGELGFWIPAINSSDIFGTTLYRSVWNPILGSVDYPLPPIAYHLKDKLARNLVLKKGETIISELQMEPWIEESKLPSKSNLESQIKNFPVGRLSGNLKYAKETSISTVYLWGVEWWYFMEKMNHPEYLKEAKKLF